MCTYYASMLLEMDASFLQEYIFGSQSYVHPAGARQSAGFKVLLIAVFPSTVSHTRETPGGFERVFL